MIAAVLLLGAGVGWGVRTSDHDPVRNELHGVALLLRKDFGGNLSALDATYIRRFLGMREGGVVGEVVKAGWDGQCWGFEIYFPKTWLAGGEGSIEVGAVERMDRSVCASGLTSEG
jgi:hypothetical protein